MINNQIYSFAIKDIRSWCSSWSMIVREHGGTPQKTNNQVMHKPEIKDGVSSAEMVCREGPDA